MTRIDELQLAIVGGGPTASSFLERLLASVPELVGERPVRVHVIDPFPAGNGRIWHGEQSELFWMNSMAEDTTMFTDASVRCAGPIRPGPSLAEWAVTHTGELPTPSLTEELRAVEGMTFPSRLIQAAYLEWFLAETLAAKPGTVAVELHRASAIDVRDEPDGRQRVALSDGTELTVDSVVLALGHLESEPDAEGAELAAFAARHGRFFVPPTNTAEVDFAGIAPGEHVIVRGLGLAFIDAAVMLTLGRGGRFVETGDGTLRYEPSGREPVIHGGSRRGVPYRSKLRYRLQAGVPPIPRYFGPEQIDALLARPEPLEFRTDVWPLIAKELTFAAYHELFNAHPERVRLSWPEFLERFDPLGWQSPEFVELVDAAVPDAADRFDVDEFDQPLAGRRFATSDELQAHLAAHIAGDVARRTDVAYSADLAVFTALLVTFGQLGRIVASGRLRASSKVRHVDGWWFSYFSYFASGPPPERLRQLLALAEAGIVRYLGAETWVRAEEESGTFVAGSASHPDTVRATALIEARIAAPSVSRSADPLVRALYERGEAVEETLVDAVDGSVWNTGRFVVSADDLRVVDAAGHPRDRRHGLGVFTNRPAAGAFARPRTNAASFRQNDHVARSVLSGLVRVAEQSEGTEARIVEATPA